MEGEGSLLSVADLELWRGQRCLFTDLTFALAPRQVAVITGANGSGKTSLLRVLAGLAVARGGNVGWRGQPVHNLIPPQRAELLYLGHLDGLKRELTVLENLNLFRRLWGIAKPAEAVLEHLRLDGLAGRAVRTLSAGQRRRAALARLGLSQADLWLLDEPFTNLDTEGRELVEGWLRRHLRDGGLAVVATHHHLQLDGAGQLRVEL
jgi:heme exporter protein A